MNNLQFHILEKNIKHFGFRDVMHFAANHARLLTMSKIEEYNNIVRYYESKYKCDFDEFCEGQKNKINSELFEEVEDAMEWRIALECVNMYELELQNLEQC